MLEPQSLKGVEWLCLERFCLSYVKYTFGSTASFTPLQSAREVANLLLEVAQKRATLKNQFKTNRFLAVFKKLQVVYLCIIFVSMHSIFALPG